MDKDSALFPLIPANTIRAARALYGRGNLYLRLGDRLNQLTAGFAAGRMSRPPGEHKTALFALLSIIQYVERLTDAELAEALEQRMELRYALHLPTPSQRLDPRDLCLFRNRVRRDAHSRGLFEEMFKAIYPEITSPAMREDAHIVEVLRSICEREIHALLMDAMLHSIEALSANHFDWLRGIALPHWYQRYNRSQIITSPGHSFRKLELGLEEMERDIQYLLHEIRASNSTDIIEMPETKNLMRIWEQFSDPKFMQDCSYCIQTIH